MKQRRTYPPLERWLSSLFSAVDDLKDRVVDREQLELTEEDILELFVPPEHHDALRATSRLVRHSYYLDTEYRIQWRGRAAVSFNAPSLLAVTEGVRLTPHARDTQLVARVDAWFERRLFLAREFGRVRWLLDQLNEHCNTPSQVRYYWPAILTLCSGRPNLGDLVEKLQEPRGGAAPPLPVNARNVCRIAAGTVTAASLLSAEAVSAPPITVKLVTLSGRILDDQAGCQVPML